MALFRIVALLFVSAFAVPAISAPPAGALYLDGDKSTIGVVLVHGRGMNPDSYVTGPLRKALNQNAGYHTVSVQLPKTTSVESVTHEAKIAEMKAIYQESRDIILNAATFLRNERGVKRIYVLAHSMGATIATTLVTQDGPAGFSGLILVGTGDYEDPPFNTTANLDQLSKQQSLPILDVYGDTVGITHSVDRALAADDVRLGAMRKSFVSAKYTQVVFNGAGHVFYGSRVDPLVKTVADWIATLEAASSK